MTRLLMETVQILIKVAVNAYAFIDYRLLWAQVHDLLGLALGLCLRTYTEKASPLLPERG